MVSCALMSAAFAATPAGAGTAPVTPMAQETQALKVAQVAQVAQATQAALPTPAMQRTQPAPAPAGRWTLMRPRPAPWADTTTTAGRDAAVARLSGAAVVFHADRVEGPSPLACANARYVFTAVPPEGLFQGSLPTPAARAAARLGLTAARLPTLRVECDTGVFDLHLSEPVRALFGLDGVVWTLRHDGPPDRSALAAAQWLMLTHFAHDMAFTPASVALKRRWLSPELARAIRAWQMRPAPADEPPAINGDPFTDTQEYPAAFRLGAPRRDGRVTVVPVLLEGPGLARRVDLRMSRIDLRWRLDDVVYEDGGTLRTLLAGDRAPAPGTRR